MTAKPFESYKKATGSTEISDRRGGSVASMAAAGQARIGRGGLYKRIAPKSGNGFRRYA
jgi:hypothetical protein